MQPTMQPQPRVYRFTKKIEHFVILCFKGRAEGRKFMLKKEKKLKKTLRQHTNSNIHSTWS